MRLAGWLAVGSLVGVVVAVVVAVVIEHGGLETQLETQQ